ncbi:hypothetical protein ACWFQ8_17465 [Streptomyces sp. NPDC055254]
MTSQRTAFFAAVDYVVNGPLTEASMIVEFGATRETLQELSARFSDSETTVVTLQDLHLVHQLFQGLPRHIKSEEHFHLVTGFYKDDYRHVASALLDSVREIDTD